MDGGPSLIFLSAILLAGAGHSAGPGVFTNAGDVGAVSRAVDARFDPATSNYTIGAGGENMWGGKDAFGFAWKSVRGDLTLAARVELQGTSAQNHRKAGVMFRQSLAPDSAYADVVIHGDGLTSLQYRAVSGGETREIQCALKAPAAVRLEKRGDYLQVSVMNAIGAFEPSGCFIKVALKGNFLAGLAVCAHDANGFETAVFKHVVFGQPAERPELPTYSIEVTAPDSPSRRVVFRWNSRLEAASFAATGDAICFRSDGRLQRLVIGRDTADDVGPEDVQRCAVAPGAMPAEAKLEGFGPNGPAWLPRISPDRVSVASVYFKGRGRGDRPDPGDYLLRIAPLAGGEPQVLASFYGDGTALGTQPWSPDGKQIVFVSREPE